jgi:putative transposase
MILVSDGGTEEGHDPIAKELVHCALVAVDLAPGLLAPTRVGHAHGPAANDGTILTERPDEMWGTDATSCFTRREGTATVFIAVDHCSAECVGIHAAKSGTRFEALEPIRQGVRTAFGEYAAAVAAGLALRHDHGSQYMSDHFQDDLRFVGIVSSPAFVREPEGNGRAERLFPTLKEQRLGVQNTRRRSSSSSSESFPGPPPTL